MTARDEAREIVGKVGNPPYHTTEQHKEAITQALEKRDAIIAEKQKDFESCLKSYEDSIKDFDTRVRRKTEEMARIVVNKEKAIKETFALSGEIERLKSDFKRVTDKSRYIFMGREIESLRSEVERFKHRHKMVTDVARQNREEADGLRSKLAEASK